MKIVGMVALCSEIDGGNRHLLGLRFFLLPCIRHITKALLTIFLIQNIGGTLIVTAEMLKNK